MSSPQAHSPNRQWFRPPSMDVPPDVRERCATDIVAGAIEGVLGCEVVSVEVNSTGEMLPAPGAYSGEMVVGLPEYCDVRLRHETPGGHVADVVVWVPLVPSGRFIGLGGGGNRPGGATLMCDVPGPVPAMTLPIGIRNGFAVATTDGGNKDQRMVDWALDVSTGEIDRDLVENWVHRSTHDMTVLAKLVVEAIWGRPLDYSYFFGASGGGRQALMEAQRYPEDYDGIWSFDPVLYYSKLYPAEFWPAMVMLHHDNALPVAKLEAFRQAAVLAAGGSTESGANFVPLDVAPAFDAFALVGSNTDAGTITALDATVMAEIWDGPRDADGTSLWFGLRPGARSWGSIVGLANVKESEAGLEPDPFFIAERYLSGWVLRDPDWDWRQTTLEEYRDAFDRSVREFGWTDTDDPDLSRFRDRGGKLLLSHSHDDSVIYSQATLKYYQSVVEEMGGIETTTSFARLFMPLGADHCSFPGEAPGLMLAQTMATLMSWVEEGVAPVALDTERWSSDGTELLATDSVAVYGLAENAAGLRN
ncbi:MAG: tannase/feruloyl esterase family alpha/beta hydrolase [Actinomycetota bacterium]|nr:tannase/feruloyl esterase family alpha/beta hydrolase [Actinomycetota bacterium]